MHNPARLFSYEFGACEREEERRGKKRQNSHKLKMIIITNDENFSQMILTNICHMCHVVLIQILYLLVYNSGVSSHMYHAPYSEWCLDRDFA